MSPFSVLLAAVLVGWTSCGGVGWNYHKNGADWGALGSCSGRRQSPIDVITAATVNAQMPALVFVTPPNGREGYTVTLKNNGHGFSISSDRFSGSHLHLPFSNSSKKVKYTLAQFHFHWNDGTLSPNGSEHRVDGRQWPLEGHFVHYDSRFRDLGAAVASGAADALAVVGVMYDVTDDYDDDLHNVFAKLSQNLFHIRDSNSSFGMEMDVDLIGFLPTDLERFWRYEGSLTTPQCNEQVIWTLMKAPKSIHVDQLRLFTEIFFSGDKEKQMKNFRLPQDINGRKVRCNAAGAPPPTAVPWNLVALVLGAALIAQVGDRRL